MGANAGRAPVQSAPTATLTRAEYRALPPAEHERRLGWRRRPATVRQPADPVGDFVADNVTGGRDARRPSRPAREVLLRCAACGTSGSAGPSDTYRSPHSGKVKSETLSGFSWSVLPLDGEADKGTLRHRGCGGPVVIYDANRASGLKPSARPAVVEYAPGLDARPVEPRRAGEFACRGCFLIKLDCQRAGDGYCADCADPTFRASAPAKPLAVRRAAARPAMAAKARPAIVWQESPEAARVYADMVTLGYFTDDGRLATWGRMRSGFDGIRQKNREAAERAGGESRLGVHVKPSGAVEYVLTHPETAARIAELAARYRAATTAQERRVIRSVRPLQPVEAGERAFHKDVLDEHQHAGRPVTVHLTDFAAEDGDQTQADAARDWLRTVESGIEGLPATGVDAGAIGEPVGFHSDLEPFIAALPTREAIALRMKLDGETLVTIAGHLDCAISTAREHVRRAAIKVLDEIEREKTLLEAA